MVAWWVVADSNAALTGLDGQAKELQIRSYMLQRQELLFGLALLLENGAAPDAANVDGHTALMFAQNGRAQVAALRAKYLASVPAAAGAPDDANLATIDAARAAHERCVQLLLANGADARRADRDGRIAADFAPRESAAAA